MAGEKERSIPRHTPRQLRDRATRGCRATDAVGRSPTARTQWRGGKRTTGNSPKTSPGARGRAWRQRVGDDAGSQSTAAVQKGQTASIATTTRAGVPTEARGTAQT